jgi:RNA methyltransferase, TrmH family
MRPREDDGGFDFHLTIASTANSRVKDIVRRRRRRHRPDRTILVEGFEELSFAVGAGVRPTVTYFCPELAGEDAAAAHHRLLRQCADAGAEVVRVSKAVFQKMAYRQSPDGWLALLPAIATELEHLRIRPAGLLIVCESVEKPGNLGAILRTADAAGIDAVIAAGPVTDWGNPNLVRASRGALFTVPVADGDSASVLAWLRQHGIRVVATTPDSDRPFTAADMTGATAIVVGAEQQGLSETWLAGADERVHIPMLGAVDSLNVATSAAIVAYEALRQRGSVNLP